MAAVLPFHTEPAFSHGRAPVTGVLLCNLGTPDAPTASAVRRYLREFLSDPRVVEIPRAVWLPLLHGIILPLRSGKSAAKYATIWTPEGSPLKVHTERQATLLQEQLDARGHRVVVRYAMRYGNPSIASQLDALKDAGATRILVLSAYPQYSATTTASVIDAVNDFHGVPERSLHLGDPYHCECHKTARLLRQALGLAESEVVVTFQSRFGKAKWLEPYTEPTLIRMAQEGCERVDVMCPGFTSDCLETLEEIAQEAQHAFMASGGKAFHYIPCLNDDPAWIEALAAIAEQHLQGWPVQAGAADGPAAQAESRLQREAALRLGAKD